MGKYFLQNNQQSKVLVNFCQHVLFSSFVGVVCILAKKETAKEKQLKEEEKILESVAEKKGAHLCEIEKVAEYYLMHTLQTNSIIEMNSQ